MTESQEEAQRLAASLFNRLPPEQQQQQEEEQEGQIGGEDEELPPLVSSAAISASPAIQIHAEEDGNEVQARPSVAKKSFPSSRSPVIPQRQFMIRNRLNTVMRPVVASSTPTESFYKRGSMPYGMGGPRGVRPILPRPSPFASNSPSLSHLSMSGFSAGGMLSTYLLISLSVVLFYQNPWRRRSL